MDLSETLVSFSFCRLLSSLFTFNINLFFFQNSHRLSLPRDKTQQYPHSSVVHNITHPTHIRRQHLTESAISDRVINSKQQCGKKTTNKLTSGPFTHLAENKDFCVSEITSVTRAGNVITAQRARGSYRLIVVAQRSPESTIDVFRKGESEDTNCF